MIDEIKSFWDNALIPVYINEDISNYFPQKTLSFLKKVGLPSDNKLLTQRQEFLKATTALEFIKTGWESDDNVKRTIPYFEFLPNNINLFYFRGDPYVFIGKQNQSSICLKGYSEEVYLIHGERPDYLPAEFPYNPVSFLNASIQYCLQFLMIELQHETLMIAPKVEYIKAYENSYWEGVKTAKKKILKIIEKMETQFRIIDDRALSESGSWWHLFLENLKHFS